MSRLIWTLLLVSFLSGCSFFEQKDPTEGWSQQKLFTEAKSAMAGGAWDKAIDYYEKLESRYPYGKYAHQAQLDIAYAYYRNGEHDSARAAADRFIKFHPNHPAEAYAHYLKGLSNFNRSINFLTRFIPSDQSQRDPGGALQSYQDFATVLEKFPDSEYTEDSRKRMLYLRNNLARYEIHVAKFYMKRGAFVAAANRANYVIENYQRTPSVSDALKIMSQAYTKLDMPELAKDAERVLAMNKDTGAIVDDPLKLRDENLVENFWTLIGLDEN